MHKAIICGASGYIGSALSTKLLARGVDVWGIGRREAFTPPLVASSNNEPEAQLALWHYQSVDAQDYAALASNPQLQAWCHADSDASNIGSDNAKGPVCYYLTWRGHERLRDGSLEEQLKNVAYVSNAIAAAAQLGCSKFVLVGSQYEVLFQHYLNTGAWHESYFESGATDYIYPACKLFAYEQAELTAYLKRIDLVHTRFSVALDSKLASPNYIARTLKSILAGQAYEPPRSPILYEMVLLEDLAQMFYLAGCYGHNKDVFYLGYGQCASLHDYFASAAHYSKEQAAHVQLPQVDGEQALVATFKATALKQRCPEGEQAVFSHDWDYVLRHLQAKAE